MDTILIVDDEEASRVLIREHLKSEGFAFFEAHDGVEAQEIMTSQPQSIVAVILDWKMPRLDGIDVLRWAKTRNDCSHIPIIMHTGMVETHDVHAAIEAGAFYFLMKSTKHDLLVSIVRTAISDFKYKKSLLDRIEQEGNPYRLMAEGTFHFRTPEEGEYLAVRLAKACSMPDAVVGLSELFANAIEHGNLSITYDEKSVLVTQGILSQTIRERLELPEHSKKYVELRMKRNEGKTVMHIKDQGRGFEFTKYLTFDESRVFDNHGRGIAIARTLLDVHYIGKGNEVIVTLPSTNQT